MASEVTGILASPALIAGKTERAQEKGKNRDNLREGMVREGADRHRARPCDVAIDFRYGS